MLFGTWIGLQDLCYDMSCVCRRQKVYYFAGNVWEDDVAVWCFCNTVF